MFVGCGGGESHGDGKERGHSEERMCTERTGCNNMVGGGRFDHISELKGMNAGCEEGRPSIQNPVSHVSLENNFIQR